MTPPFERKQPTEGCLSAWQVSQWVMSLLTAEQRSQAERHAAQCDYCQERFANEQADYRAAMFEAVPHKLAQAAARARSKGRRFFHVPVFGTLAVAGAAAAALLVVSRWMPGDTAIDPGKQAEPAATIRSKGYVGLEATLVRKERTVVERIALRELTGYKPGDQLQLYASGQSQRYLAVEGLEHDQWVRYFNGLSPANEALPFVLELDASGKTAFRLLSCAQPLGDRSFAEAAASTACRVDHYELVRK